MPELPEVETVVRALKNNLPGLILQEIKEYRPGTLSDYSRISWKNEIIQDVWRRGKYIIIQGYHIQIVIHLRMTGKLILSKCCFSERDKNYIRGEMIFSSGDSLLFHDVRTFGTIAVYPVDDCPPPFLKLGIEPFSDNFTWQFLQEKLKNRAGPIKNLLLNQEIIAGLGNIYAVEILFRSRINPLKSGKNLSSNELKKIVNNTKRVLNEAVHQKGTTLSDYRQVSNEIGSFQNFLQIYGKKTCPKGHSVSVVKQAGRTTYYCPICQFE